MYNNKMVADGAFHDQFAECYKYNMVGLKLMPSARVVRISLTDMELISDEIISIYFVFQCLCTL
jgi:hypothetical protein